MTRVASSDGVSGEARARPRSIDAVVAAEGLAIGQGTRLPRGEATAASPPQGLPLRDAVARVRRDLAHLQSTLGRHEAELFAPETRILDELEPRLLAREASDPSRAGAVLAETSCGCTDLILDLRVRLLDALAGSSPAKLGTSRAVDGAAVVLLTEVLTPSMVTGLPPDVVGVIAAVDGPTEARRDVGRSSHVAALARGRGLVVVYVTSEELASIPDASSIVVDASPGGGQVWVDPDDGVLSDARRQSAARRGEPGSPCSRSLRSSART